MKKVFPSNDLLTTAKQAVAIFSALRGANSTTESNPELQQFTSIVALFQESFEFCSVGFLRG